MDYLAQHRKSPSKDEIIGSNVQPSEYVFTILSSTPLCSTIVAKLLKGKEKGLYVSETLIKTISTNKIMDLITENELFVL